MNQDVPLADFAPGRRKSGARPSTRVTGAGLTACVYAVVALIAADVGYGSEAALSRAFKAQCGQTPREWKLAQPG